MSATARTATARAGSVRAGGARASGVRAGGARIAAGQAGGTARQGVPAPRRSPAPPPLRVVPDARRGPAARTPFMLLVGGLLSAGLIGLLLLNTVLAQGAFVLHDLKRQSGQLTDTEQALEQGLALAGSPARLAQRADALGMVPSTNPVFIRASDGKILGVPEAGKPKPTPTPTPSASAPTTAVPAVPSAGSASAGASPGASGGAR